MLKKLTDRIYYLPPDRATDRPILGYIKGNNASFMVDAGNSQAHASLFLGELENMKLPLPSYVGITHWHWDHCYGLDGINAASVACRKTNEKLKEMALWQWNDEAMYKRLNTGEDIEFCDTHIRKEYPDRTKIHVKTADIIFEDTLEVNLGNISCRLINLENSHSPDSIVIFIPEEKVIFLGDIVSPDFHNGEPKYYKEKMLKLFNSLSELDFETAICGHDEPEPREVFFGDLKEELRSLL